MVEVSALEQWPSYNIGSVSHLHAVGVLVANWAEVEQSYKCLIQYTLSGQAPIAMRIFELLGNDGRATFIREETIKIASPQYREHIEHFLKCAAICKENRNAVAHAHFIPSQDPEVAILNKGRSKDGTQTKLFRFTVPAIREMADEIHAIAEYGHHMWALMEVVRSASRGVSIPAHLVAIAQAPLLSKPAQPRKWDLRSQETR